MYEHRNPTIGRDMTTPGSIGKKPSKPVDKKPTKPIEDKKPKEKPDCKPVEDKKPIEKPVEDKKPDKKPVEDKKPVKDEKKIIDPWSRLLFGPPRRTQPTDDKKGEQRPPFWWI